MKRIPIPEHHQPIINIINTISGLGTLLCIWGLIKLSAWETIFGMEVVEIGKSWFLDRMVWLYDEMKVSVETAKLHGMKDFLIVHRSHPFIMNDKKVLQQIVAFINNGMFGRDKPTEQ